LKRACAISWRVKKKTLENRARGRLLAELRRTMASSGTSSAKAAFFIFELQSSKRKLNFKWLTGECALAIETTLLASLEEAPIR